MKQTTTRLKFAWVAPVSGTCHVELDELPKLSNTNSKRSPRRLLVEFVFFPFIRIKYQNACLVIHFLTNQMQIKSNEKLYWWSVINFVLVKMGPKGKRFLYRLPNLSLITNAIGMTILFYIIFVLYLIVSNRLWYGLSGFALFFLCSKSDFGWGIELLYYNQVRNPRKIKRFVYLSASQAQNGVRLQDFVDRIFLFALASRGLLLLLLLFLSGVAMSDQRWSTCSQTLSDGKQTQHHNKIEISLLLLTEFRGFESRRKQLNRKEQDRKKNSSSPSIAASTRA